MILCVLINAVADPGDGPPYFRPNRHFFWRRSPLLSKGLCSDKRHESESGGFESGGTLLLKYRNMNKACNGFIVYII